MTIYKLEMQDDSCKSSLEFDADDLGDVIANMEIFLKGCGFYFDGILDIHEGGAQMNTAHLIKFRPRKTFEEYIDERLDKENNNDGTE